MSKRRMVLDYPPSAIDWQRPILANLEKALDEVKEYNQRQIQGLLRGGGSSRRKTPVAEISHPLPSNAAWRQVSLCSGNGQKEKLYAQAWSDMDEPLCKLCQTPCKGNNAKIPQFFEDLFCRLDCLEEYRSRTSNRFLREIEIIKPFPFGLMRKSWGNQLSIISANGCGTRGRAGIKLVSLQRPLPWVAHIPDLQSFLMTLQKAMLGMQATSFLSIKGVKCDLDVQSSKLVDDDDGDLLIEIPGSAYSGSNTNTSDEQNQQPQVLDQSASQHICSPNVVDKETSCVEVENPCNPAVAKNERSFRVKEALAEIM